MIIYIKLLAWLVEKLQRATEDAGRGISQLRNRLQTNNKYITYKQREKVEFILKRDLASHEMENQ